MQNALLPVFQIFWNGFQATAAERSNINIRSTYYLWRFAGPLKRLGFSVSVPVLIHFLR